MSYSIGHDSWYSCGSVEGLVKTSSPFTARITFNTRSTGLTFTNSVDYTAKSIRKRITSPRLSSLLVLAYTSSGMGLMIGIGWWLRSDFCSRLFYFPGVFLGAFFNYVMPPLWNSSTNTQRTFIRSFIHPIVTVGYSPFHYYRNYWDFEFHPWP